MDRSYEALCAKLKVSPKTWLITGAAGFIGSNILETLLNLDQKVIGLDNFFSGYQHNLDGVERLVGRERWRNFTFIEGDIRNLVTCRHVCEHVDYVLHQAALGSVPLSIEDPLIANEINIRGFLNMLVAARDAKVKRFVYAASSATYGDQPDLPKIEEKIGTPLSPYAVTKLANELYAAVFAKAYGFKSIGLRYFNIFGQRQDPNGAYAAVIPKWFSDLIKGENIYINGDGETTRDFCFIDNAVQANILAATVNEDNAVNQVYNVAVGERTSLNDLFAMIQHRVAGQFPHALEIRSNYREFREGDVMHSQADISKAREMLGYQPGFSVGEGLDKAANWYLTNLA